MSYDETLNYSRFGTFFSIKLSFDGMSLGLFWMDGLIIFLLFHLNNFEQFLNNDIQDKCCEALRRCDILVNNSYERALRMRGIELHSLNFMKLLYHKNTKPNGTC